MLKNIFVVISIMFGIILAVITGVILAAMLPRGGGGEMQVSGFGVNVQNVNTSTPTSRLARQAAQMSELPQISDQMLRESIQSILENARRGDVSSAVFMLELASAQKARAAELAKASATQPTTR